MSVPERKALIETDGAELPVSTQAELLGLNRSGLYYKPVAPDEEDLKIKRMIDELYTAHPEFGYRRMCVWLNKEKKLRINHKAVYRHMREMGIQAVYPRQNTSKASPENPVYPYLLNGLRITRPNQVRSEDTRLNSSH